MTGSYLLKDGIWSLYDEDLNWVAKLSTEYLNFTGLRNVAGENTYEEVLALYNAQKNLDENEDYDDNYPNYDENVDLLNDKYRERNDVLQKLKSQSMCAVRDPHITRLKKSIHHANEFIL